MKKSTIILLIGALSAINSPIIKGQTKQPEKRNLIQESKNKEIAVKYFHTFYNEKDIVKSRRMMTTDFKNHHPGSGIGADATLAAVSLHLFNQYPDFKVFIKRIAAEGDLVWIQCYTQDTPYDRGKMSMDIFRIQEGKIAEHWDIIQPIPDGVSPSEMYN